MSDDINDKRVKYYSENDFSVSFFIPRIEEILNKEIVPDGLDVNDAIELYQCNLILSNCLSEEAKQSERFSPLIAQISSSKSMAFRAVSESLETKGLSETYDNTCLEYKDALIDIMSDGNLCNLVEGEEVKSLLSDHPGCISIFLKHKKLVERYSTQLRTALLDNPEIAARLIITAKAVDDKTLKKTTVPKSLTQSDVNQIFSEYISGAHPHNNYLEVIAKWRDDWKPGLYPEVKSAAEKRIAQNNDELLEYPHTGIKYGVEVQFSDDQEECMQIDVEDNVTIYRYSTKWIRAYSDQATLLNNCIYIFGIADMRSLLESAKPDNSHSVFFDLLTLKVRNRYKTGIGFNLKDMHLQGTIVGYDNVLKRIGVGLEDLIEWYFNDYIESEYGIAGFRVDMPKEGTYYAKCITAFSQIERVLKAYILFIRLGEIDKDVFKHQRFFGFHNLPSRIEKKYVVPNADVNQEYGVASWSLFSDQCMLSYNPNNSSDNYSCFFDRLVHSEVKRSDCPEYEFQRLDWLIEHDLLIETSNNAVLMPTKKLEYTWRVWKEGCILYPAETAESKEIIESLVTADYFCFSSTLLAPQEADYFSFFYHDKDFTNAIALRNNYSHGHDLSDDPNGQIHISSYYRALQLLVQLIIKIDNEFSLSRSPEMKVEFVEWPLLKVEAGALNLFQKDID